MKATVVSVRRYTPLNGWMNRILRIALDPDGSAQITVQETAPYVPDFLAARGIAARIVWEEYPEPVAPFDPRNPLMVMPGVLTGSNSPYSGRTNICAFSPQSWPYNYFTRSSIGGRFGGELKRAGYDGVIITGASATPVRILIRDDEVSVLPAEDLWGQGALDTLEALEASIGKGVRSLAIGPAGERLSRIATIQTASSSASGMGGFGAVMGSKKLKAVSVVGTGKVKLADPERVTELARAVGEEARTFRQPQRGVERQNQQLAAEGGGYVRPYACTESCPSPCQFYYHDVPGCAYQRKYSGQMMCVGTLFQGSGEGGAYSTGGLFDWNLGTRGGLELNVLSNNYGLNQWDIILSMVPWLEACQWSGLLSEINGRPINWRSASFWAEYLKDIAYRQGMGDAFAEGGWRAAQALHLGEDLVRRYYTGWGYSGHWDGHGSWSNPLVYPFWLVSALQWLTDTRDPIPSGHGYVHTVTWQTPMVPQRSVNGIPPITWDQVREISRRIYGDPRGMDPCAGYEGRAKPGVWHTRRSVMKDCLSADDFIFPLMISPNTQDHYYRVSAGGSPGVEGPAMEHALFTAGTGTDWTPEDLERAAERIYTLERANTVRHWGRDRKMDESILPSFEYPENWVNPILGERHALDRQRFAPVMDEYYTLRGWDAATGWPTPSSLQALGLAEVYEPMVAGARKARETLPPLPPVPAEPVPQLDAFHGIV